TQITKDPNTRTTNTLCIFIKPHKCYATLMGLNEDTPFVIGASVGVLSNLGVNSVGKGEVAVTIGTSGAIRTVIDNPRTDYKGRIFCY
ncbi:gluconate kinase, partial [Staphylococcus aureus]|nr:gluconate kinase [Staphylococcus aureus]